MEGMMKNRWKQAAIVVIALGLALAIMIHPASARVDPIAPKADGIAPGLWKWTGHAEGKEIDIGQLTTPNAAWLQMLTEGLSISGPATICHSFRGALYGWTGSIYELKGDSWQKLDTTIEWYPDKEGEYRACAYAPEAGIYSLFGSYKKPSATTIKAVNKCPPRWLSSLDMIEYPGGGYVFTGTVASISTSVKVSYSLVNITPEGSVTGALTGTILTDGSGNFTFTTPFFVDYGSVEYFYYKFLVNGCPLKLSSG
jgi:hypothetical protein